MILPKLYERDFPVITYQIHGRWYLHMFGHDIPVEPRNVTVLKNGRGAMYRGDSVEKTINDLLLADVRHDPAYITRSIQELKQIFDAIDVRSRKIFDTRESLTDFLGRMSEWWPGVYLGNHVPRDERFMASDRKAALEFRKRTDTLEYQAFDCVRDTLEALYGPLSKYIYLDELMNSTIPNQEVLEMRKGITLYIVDGRVLSHEEFIKEEERLNFSLAAEPEVSGIRQFSGQTAYPGIVRGTAQILFGKGDLNSFVNNNILITPMTIPSFLPAMHKASAFVTDEGGITCHAAIVAREMKKPCIIGTKIATKALHDGDLIEVDAEKGVVSILKSHER